MENEANPPELPEAEPENTSQPAVEEGVERAEVPAGATLPEPAASTQAEASQPAEGQAPVEGEETGEVEPAAQPARRSWFYRVLRFMFSPETRLGRVMRPFLRWTAAVVGLFALGLLAGYLLLYQPTLRQLGAAIGQIEQKNSEIARLQGETASLQNTLVAADQRLQTAQGDLVKAQARNNLLVVIYDIANARTYLAQKNGAKVMETLQQAQVDLQAIQPYLVANDKELADELSGRLQTVSSVLVRDSQLAVSDLNNLYDALLAANDLLFGH
jgi:hypothetical protein